MSTPEIPVTRADGIPIRALVVDDEPNLAELLSAALRYEGWEVEAANDGLTAVRLAKEHRPDQVVLEFVNDGGEIATQMLETLFDRFTKGDSARTPSEASSGLGLSIVKAIVEAHGGKIWAESANGMTKFSVTLPLDKSSTEHAPHATVTG